MINTNADIEFSKMLYPTIPLNYFLVDTGLFIQVNFNMLAGTIDLTQIPNTYITYAKLNIGAGDIAYWKLTLTSWITNNDLSGSINFNKMLYPAYNGYFLRDDGTFQPVSGGTIPDDSIDLIKLKTVVGNAYNLYGYSSVGVPIATK